MSARSTRKVNKHEKDKNSNVSTPRFYEDNVGKSFEGSGKKVRRIRKTNDMICFESSMHEDNSIMNRTYERQQISPMPKINELPSPFFEKASRKSTLKVPVITTTNSLSCKFQVEEDTSNGKFMHSTTQQENSEFKQTENKKIVKARRFFKVNHADVEETKDVELALIEKHHLQTNEEVWVEDEEHLLRPEMKKESLNTYEMTVKELPSPITPSENSIEINNRSSTLSQHLQFNSSKEELHPSTSGVVDSTKRRTYELEDSINDISLLKSISERDSTRISSFPNSEDSQDYKTPSRVTERRKWNKPQHFSAHLSDSPRWINRKTLKKSNSFSKDVKKQEVAGVSTSKKYVSKVKMPNFAAIHTRAMQKIESISEYKQRKDDRAKTLLSGLKPKNVQKSSSKKENPSVQKSSNKKDSRKHLRFAPNTTLKEKSPTFIPLPSTPLPRKVKNVAESPITSYPFEEKKFDFVFSKENKFNEAPVFKQRNVEEKVLTVKNCFPIEIKKPVFVFSKEKQIGQIPVFKPQNVEKKFLAVKNCNIKENFNAFSYKAATNDVQKNLIKSIVTKSKPVSNTLEVRRCTIKGVRSNRRFDLLMNMRKGK